MKKWGETYSLLEIAWTGACFCSVTQPCLTLYDPIDCSTPASLSITISQSLLRLLSIELVMPSKHLVLCHPFFLQASNLFQHQGLFQWVSCSRQVAKVLELKFQRWWLKRCTTGELWLKFYLGQNEDCRPGGSISDSPERLLQSSSGEGQYIRFW